MALLVLVFFTKHLQPILCYTLWKRSIHFFWLVDYFLLTNKNYLFLSRRHLDTRIYLYETIFPNLNINFELLAFQLLTISLIYLCFITGAGKKSCIALNKICHRFYSNKPRNMWYTVTTLGYHVVGERFSMRNQQ